MNIIYIITNIKKCGPYNVLKEQAIYASKQDSVHIFSIFGKDDKDLLSDLHNHGINTHVIFDDDSMVHRGAKLKAYAKKLSTMSPQVVHSHGLIPDIVNTLVKIPQSHRLTTIHNNMHEDYQYNWGHLIGGFWCIIHKIFLKKLDLCICCSSSIFDSLWRRGVRNITYIRNGVRMDDNCRTASKLDSRVAVMKQFNIDLKEQVFLYAGVLSNRKAVFELAKTFSKNHTENQCLVIAGTGADFERIQELHDKSILLLGYVDDPDILFKAADIYISNSKSEGLSISALQAVKYGLRLLLSDIPSHIEIVKISGCSKATSIFTNMQELSEKIQSLSTYKPANYGAKVLRKISSSQMCSQYYKIYKEITL